MKILSIYITDRNGKTYMLIWKANFLKGRMLIGILYERCDMDVFN